MKIDIEIVGVSIENYKQRFHWSDWEIPMTTIVV